MKKRIICYGAGKEFYRIIPMLCPSECDLVAVIDRQAGKPLAIPENGMYWSIPKSWGTGGTISPDSLNEYEFDYVLICSSLYREAMSEKLRTMGVPSDKIVFAVNGEMGFDYRQLNLSMFSQMNMSVNHQILSRFTNSEVYDTIICRELGLRRERLINDFQLKCCEDYVRVSTIELLAHRIIHENIQGNIAEVGVFRGDMAKILNEMFPERNLHLFDTFESFDKSDCMIDESMFGSEVADSFIQMFKNTSVEIVMSKMKHPEKCIVHKGFFPDTAKNLPQMQFAFVSLDVDLFQPTYEGLQYFYPRLADHGYIIIHDCLLLQDRKGNITTAGKAVDLFCKENSLQYIPVTDIYGSVILTKQTC